MKIWEFWVGFISILLFIYSIFANRMEQRISAFVRKKTFVVLITIFFWWISFLLGLQVYHDDESRGENFIAMDTGNWRKFDIWVSKILHHVSWRDKNLIHFSVMIQFQFQFQRFDVNSRHLLFCEGNFIFRLSSFVGYLSTSLCSQEFHHSLRFDKYAKSKS